jgi:hypothetical protein
MPGFRGVYPAIITPMTAEGDLNEAAFREVMEFNIRAGVHGPIGGQNRKHHARRRGYDEAGNQIGGKCRQGRS